MKWYKCIPIVLLLAASFATPIFGNKPVLIVSGSMEPAIQTGALTLVHYCGVNNFQVGDVCTYWSPDFGEYITHRVRVVGEDYLITRGDTNSVDDPTPVIEDMVMGKVVLTLNITAPLFQRYLVNRVFNRMQLIADLMVVTVLLGIGVYAISYAVTICSALHDMWTNQVTTSEGRAYIDAATNAPSSVNSSKYSLYRRLRVYLSYCAYTRAAKDVAEELNKMYKRGAKQ